MSAEQAIPGTVVPIGALVSPGGGSGLQGLQGPQGPAGGSGGGTTYTASQSVLLAGTNFTLVNDVATPVAGQCYGYTGGARGWFTPPGASYTGTNSILLTGTNFTLFNDASPPALGQFYGYRNGARQWCQPNFFNILDYGADPSGGTDSTQAITNAIAAMPSWGGTLYFPVGSYIVSSGIHLNKSGVYFGDGPNTTFIRTTSATADVFVIGIVSDLTIAQMGFTTAVTRTGGFYITCPNLAWGINIRDFNMKGGYHGIYANWTTGIISNGYIENCAPGSGVGIYAVQAVNIEWVTMSNSNQIAIGLYLLNNGGSGCIISNCSFIACGTCLQVSANAGNILQACYVHDCEFDSSTYGVIVSSGGSGTLVNDAKFSNCWVATNTTYGFYILTDGVGKVDGVLLNGCSIFNNGTYGVLISDSGCTNIRVISCNICGNCTTGGNAGVYLAANVSGFTIANCRIGSGFRFNGNIGYGIALVGNNTNFVINGNDLRGNSIAPQFNVGVGTFVNTNNI